MRLWSLGPVNVIIWVELMGKEEARGEEKMPRGRLER